MVVFNNEIENRIQTFEFIKNIPYKIGLYLGAPDYCCSSKSLALAKLFANIGLKTRQVICTFDWKETPLPSEVLSFPYEEYVTHQFTEVFIPETQNWVYCDSTWDSELSKGGFEIAKWDGINSTKLAVKPHKILSVEESSELIKKWSNPKDIERHLEYCRNFYNALNCYLQSLRL